MDNIIPSGITVLRHQKLPPEMSYTKSCSQENTCVGVSFIKKTPAQVFSCEYWEMFKDTNFEKQLQMATPASHSRVPP